MFLYEREEILGIHHVILILIVNFPDSRLVGVGADGIVGNPDGYPEGTFLAPLADHLHYPRLILVGNGECLSGACVAVFLHEVGHCTDSLACGLAAFEGDVDERAVVEDGIGGGVLKLRGAAPSGLSDHELMLIHVADHVVGLLSLRDLTPVAVVAPVDHASHLAGGIRGARGVEEVAETGVGIIGIRDHHRSVGSGFSSGDEIRACLGSYRHEKG